jgi:glycine cleavage system aminomethyltransferase T
LIVADEENRAKIKEMEGLMREMDRDYEELEANYVSTVDKKEEEFRELEVLERMRYNELREEYEQVVLELDELKEKRDATMEDIE